MSGWWLEPGLGVLDSDSTAALHKTVTLSVTLCGAFRGEMAGAVCHMLTKGRDELGDHPYKVTMCVEGAG